MICLVALAMVLSTSMSMGETKVGSVVLDEVTFSKLVPTHDIVLVKFDQMYPWGDHLKEYKKLVDRLSKHPKILLAEVPVADFGEKQNAKLAQRYNVKTKTYDYPQYRLFLKGKGIDNAIEYKGNNDAEDITKFIILTSGTWLQLPGCVVVFDDLIKDFLNKTEEERERVIQAGDALVTSGTFSIPEDETAARTYLKIMRRLSAVEGDEKARKALLEEDLKRTDKIMMLEKVHPDKIQRLKFKMNIIGSFFYNGMSASGIPTFDNEEIQVTRRNAAGEIEDEDEDEDEEDELEASQPEGKEEL